MSINKAADVVAYAHSVRTVWRAMPRDYISQPSIGFDICRTLSAEAQDPGKLVHFCTTVLWLLQANLPVIW